ncbi:Ninja-family protein AFP3 [Hibiscus syriacus]|uniref:Ninja-family protein n=1 Tax=Hibiscus syriacus TaxID=106335 RepID=A0A6A2ZT82_HIBSY|nr:Ninja-family protein AFP3 [Hibiscus syriacus]
METDEEIGRKETQRNISMQVVNLPSDLLERFISSSNHFSLKSHEKKQEGEGNGEEIELSLGLSLNGRVEEEWRKRKELQSLRRLEANRKRCAKQNNLKALKDRNREGFGEEDKREEACNNGGSQGSIGSQGSGSSGISELESQPPQDFPVLDIPPSSCEDEIPLSHLKNGPWQFLVIMELLRKPKSRQETGTYKCPRSRSPACVQSATQTDQKPNIIPGKILTQNSGNLAGIIPRNQHNQPEIDEKSVKATVRNIMEDMPCVSTTGDGPNGKRIEGFLYRYRKGEEVRIVCVCHGSFLSPAEFVKHAGSDVEHPLKHIVVSPSFIF